MLFLFLGGNSQCNISGGGGTISAGTTQTYVLTCGACTNCNSPNFWFITIPVGGSITIGGTTYNGPSTQTINSNNNLTVLYNTSGTYNVWWEWGSSICNPSCPAGGVTNGPTITVTGCTPDNPCWNPPVLCELDAPINLNTLLCGAATTGGTWSGTGVSGNIFDPAGLGGTNPSVTYSLGVSPCDTLETHNITVTNQTDACWNGMTICEDNPLVDLNTLLCGTATTGGTWSGTGVTGSMFNPLGLGGSNVSITYNVGTGACSDSEIDIISVIDKPNSPNGIDTIINSCQTSFCIDLNHNRSCSSGLLNWYTTNTPTSATPTIPIPNNYCTASTITLYGFCFDASKPPGCQFSDSIETTINMTTIPDPCWNSPNNICSGSPPIDLNTLLCPSADIGGAWSGIGVTGNMFDPTGLTGQTLSITYSLGTAPCDTSETHSISIIDKGDPCFNPALQICENDGLIDLATWLCPGATTGGTWSGIGVTGNFLNTSGLGGQNITITYTTGVTPCDSSQSHIINITAITDPCWNPVSTICENSLPVDLTTLLCPGATTGGTWSGNGVTGNIFYPNGLGGQNITITYQVGQSFCDSSQSHIFSITSPPPTPTGGNLNAPVCYGDCFNLNQGRSCSSGSLNWYTIPNPTLATTPITNPSFFCPISNSISYGFCVDAAGTSGCQFSDSVETVINLSPISNPCWNSPTTICNNQGIINLNNWLCPGSTTGGIWSVNGIVGSNFDPSTYGGQTISVSYTVGNSPCDSILEQDVIVTLSDASFQSSNFCLGEYNQVLVTGFSGGTFTLTNITGASINQNTGVITGALLDEIYSIKYKVTSPCTDSSEVNIMAVDCDSIRPIIFVPNTFTPNSDGFNNLFIPVALNIENYHLYIFNRWGELLFETQEILEGWDGTYKGIKCPIDTYVWRIVYKGINSTKTFSKIGHVNIIR